MVTLHDYWRSSASYRLRIAMGLAGMEWEAVTVDLQAGAQTSEAHMSRNPQGLVPVLEIDGHSFTQSLSILEYLDETRDLGLLPKDPAGRQAVRALSYAIAMEIHPVCNLRVAKHAVAASGARSPCRAGCRPSSDRGLPRSKPCWTGAISATATG